MQTLINLLTSVMGLPGNRTARSSTTRRAELSLRPCGEALDDRLLLSTAPVFTATPISGTQIQLSWNPVNCQGYYVDEWETVNGKGTWVTIANPNTLKQSSPSIGPDTYTISGLKPSTNYIFDVASYGSGTVTWAKNDESATTYSATYPVFTLEGGFSNTQIEVQWTAVAGAKNYLVQEYELIHVGKFIELNWVTVATLSSSTTNHTVGGLTPGTSYSFRVASEGSWGTTYANAQSITPYLIQ